MNQLNMALRLVDGNYAELFIEQNVAFQIQNETANLVRRKCFVMIKKANNTIALKNMVMLLHAYSILKNYEPSSTIKGVLLEAYIPFGK